MGCWNETCAVTGAPIFESDPVVMVVFHKHAEGMWAVGGPSCYDEIELIAKGEYDDYGWVKVDGKVAGEPGTLRGYLRSIFVRRDAWDSIIASESADPSAKTEQLAEYSRVARSCFLCRIDLRGGLEFKGSQSASEKRYEHLLKLMQVAAQRLRQANLSEYDEF